MPSPSFIRCFISKGRPKGLHYIGVESALAPRKNDSDDHQHDADRTPHRESLDDRAERADVIDDDRGDNLPGYNETDRGADAEPRRKVRDGYYVASDNDPPK